MTKGKKVVPGLDQISSNKYIFVFKPAEEQVTVVTWDWKKI